jgi:hypothetical protein
LRRYKAEEVTKAADELAALAAAIDGFPRGHQTADKLCLRALAWSAQANAVAHNFIFWDKIDRQNLDPTSRLQNWKRVAEQLAEKAAHDLAKPHFANEPANAVQLRWLVSNARGNLALNRAKCAGPTGIADDDARALVLEEALHAFHECETLVKPGVETLTNIATTLLALKRPTEALAYTTRARALNPKYEYAYLRESEAQKMRNDPTAMRSVLHTANQNLAIIRIEQFQKIFEDQGIRYHDR